MMMLIFTRLSFQIKSLRSQKHSPTKDINVRLQDLAWMKGTMRKLMRFFKKYKIKKNIENIIPLKRQEIKFKNKDYILTTLHIN